MLEWYKDKKKAAYLKKHGGMIVLMRPPPVPIPVPVPVPTPAPTPTPTPTPDPIPDGPHAVALFQDDNPDALAVSAEWVFHKNLLHKFVLRYQMPAGTTSPTTFKVRAGGSIEGGRVTFNGMDGVRVYGGKMVSSMNIKERTP